MKIKQKILTRLLNGQWYVNKKKLVKNTLTFIQL